MFDASTIDPDAPYTREDELLSFVRLVQGAKRARTDYLAGFIESVEAAKRSQAEQAMRTVESVRAAQRAQAEQVATILRAAASLGVTEEAMSPSRFDRFSVELGGWVADYPTTARLVCESLKYQVEQLGEQWNPTLAILVLIVVASVLDRR